MIRLVALLAALTASAPAFAATLHADPRSLDQVIARARGGDMVVLAAGDYTNVRITDRQFSPAVVIQASQARITQLSLRNVEGLKIQGGHFRLAPPIVHPRTGKPAYGAGIRMDMVRDIAVSGARLQGPGGETEGSAYGEGHGVFVVQGSGITVEDGSFAGLVSGIALSKVSGFRLVRNQFSHMRSDGIQVGEGRRGLIEANTCNATRIRDEEHPDCIQLWSRPTSLPTADVVIRGNRATGKMQGIGLFNHIRNGVDDGGFDRVVIEDNEITVGYPQAIAILDGRNSVIRNNRVETLPGSRWRASINLRGDVRRCGNKVGAGGGTPGQTDKRCDAE